MDGIETLYNSAPYNDEDLRQEYAVGLLLAARDVDRERPETEQRAFLMTRARGRVLHYLREDRARRYFVSKKNRAAEIDPTRVFRADLAADEDGAPAWEYLQGHESAADAVERAEFVQRVRERVAALPLDLRKLAGQLENGLSGAEIARREGVSRMAVCKRIKRLREAMAGLE